MVKLLIQNTRNNKFKETEKIEDVLEDYGLITKQKKEAKRLERKNKK